MRGGFQEVQKMKNIGYKAYFGIAASRNNFLNEYTDPENKHIHIATHGISNGQIREDVVLLFKQNKTKLDTLYGYELLGYSSSINSVIISACQVGKGFYNSTTGNYNLARYFVINGAEYVVSSTWNLTDASSTLIFKEFYNEFENQPIPENLRNAKIHLLRTRKDLSHPYYWACLQINP